MSQPSPQGHLEMLTTCDRLADAVDICAEPGRVLETVHLSGLLIAPAVLEAAAGAGGGGQSESRGRVKRGEPVIVVSLDDSWQ